MPKINVYITVDTEHSIGGAFRDPNLSPVGNKRRIFAESCGKSYGIPLIMDIADAYNIPLTFFLETLNKYFFGEEETREACQFIIDRGHDVQLHIHPTFLNFSLSNPGARFYSDNISDYSLDKQIQLIKEGKDILIRNEAKPPIAFRAGNFGANSNTLEALKVNGFLIDSSYNISYKKFARNISNSELNDSAMLEGIWEIPITNFVECLPLGLKHFRPMDLISASYREMKFVLNQAKQNGPSNITIILHSFSFIKAFDVQYRKIRPRFNVIRRFEKLCRFLHEHPGDYKVLPLCSLSKEKLFQMSQVASHSFPEIPILPSLLRGFEQLREKFP